MTKPQITIVGLGLIGNSIGLALAQGERDFELVGHDKDPGAASAAKKMKAVDRAEWNLINACVGADLLILALPLHAIQATLQAVAADLKQGCIVLDTTSLKMPAVAWANELLPDGNNYIGTNPILASQASGGAAARADLFERVTWAVCPTAATAEAAVKTAVDLITRLGGHPLFLEPAEHDGMLAAVEHLPALLSTALMAGVTSQPGWREMRQLAGGQFESTTHLVNADPQGLAGVMLNNQQNLARWIGLYIDKLTEWQMLLASEDAQALGAAIEDATGQRERWLAQRQKGQWEDKGQGEMPDKKQIYGGLFGMGRLFERKPPTRTGKK
jgi:prephenate dehydrogenase